MPTDNRSQRPSSSGWPGSAGSFSSRGSFRPRSRPNSTSEQSQNGFQLPNSSSYNNTGSTRYFGGFTRDSRDYSNYKNRQRSSSYYSSRDGYSQESSQPDAMSTPPKSANRYHPRNNFTNQNYYQPRYTSRNDQRDQKQRYQHHSSSSYYGSGSRQNSLNSNSNNTFTKEDFYDNSHSYSSNNFNDQRRSYNTGYPKRTDRADDNYRFQRTSRPSLIPKDFKDDYNDDEDEELEKQLRNSVKRISESEAKSEISKDDIKKESEESGDEDEESAEEDNEKSDVKIPEPLMKENSPGKEEESDNYDPEIEQNELEDIKDVINKVDISPKKDNHPILSNIDETLSNNIVKNQEEKLPQVKIKQIIVPLKTPDSDIFPLPRLEDKLWELKNHQKKDIISQLPYLLKKPIQLVSEYPFYSRNFLVHEQVIRPKLLKNISIIKTNTFLTKSSLINEYQQRSLDWEDRLNEMKEQLQSLYPIKDSNNDENEETGEHENTRSSTSRRGRGDAVQSEAEFLEILKTLGAEEENEPLHRAEHLAAPIPDMILNPTLKNIFLTNINNLVTDKEEWATSINVDGIDNFSRKEHELFCEGFLSFPKRFGRISAHMGGLRTAEDCVLHYYRTKKTLTDYKQLLALKKKRRKGQKGKRGPKPKSIVNTPTNSALDTPQESGDELSLENLIPKEVSEEVYYTETGRRRRAAAPVFESNDLENGKMTPNISGDNDRKRSLEAPSSTEPIIEESKESTPAESVPPVKKKPRGPKPKKQMENSSTPPVISSDPIESQQPIAESKNKGNITSYWSVRDTNLFTRLLSEYGQNWMVIAEHIKTKSAVMVRNYYHRNADDYGWKKIVEDAEDRLKTENPDYVAPKNPPLGVFTASTNVPSNINVTYTTPPWQPPQQTQVQALNSNLPQVQLPTPLPSSSTFSNTSITSPIPPILTGLKEPISRSNPFSITSLLNPPESRKQESSTSLPSPNINGGIKTERSFEPVRNEPVPIAASNFNPLNTLLDAAQSSPGWNNEKTLGSKSFESVRTVYGRDTPNYTGGYQAAYSESSIRGGRPILNDETRPAVEQQTLPSISSNLKNILIDDNSAKAKE